MPGSHVGADLWITEYITPCDVYHHGISRVLDCRRTRFQQMQIVESETYGKALVLDGKWQSCTGDEFLYHEPLVHVACVHHGAPRTVLVLGGGEGATVREVLKWNTVEKVAMVDIDGEVVEACKEHLPRNAPGSVRRPANRSGHRRRPRLPRKTAAPLGRHHLRPFRSHRGRAVVQAVYQGVFRELPSGPGARRLPRDPGRPDCAARDGYARPAGQHSPGRLRQRCPICLVRADLRRPLGIRLGRRPPDRPAPRSGSHRRSAG